MRINANRRASISDSKSNFSRMSWLDSSTEKSFVLESFSGLDLLLRGLCSTLTDIFGSQWFNLSFIFRNSMKQRSEKCVQIVTFSLACEYRIRFQFHSEKSFFHSARENFRSPKSIYQNMQHAKLEGRK